MSIQRPSSMPSDDVDVREEDQLQLNEFGAINSRLFEIRDDMKELKKQIDSYTDAVDEIPLIEEGDDSLLLNIGDGFIFSNEDELTTFLEEKIDQMKAKYNSFHEEEQAILDRQKELKVILYGRFGRSINLEA